MSRWNKFLPRNSVQRGSGHLGVSTDEFSTSKRVLYANFVARVHTSQDLQGPNQKVSWFIEIFILPTFSQETLLKRNVSHVVSSLPACLALECCKYTFFFKISFRNFKFSFFKFYLQYLIKKLCWKILALNASLELNICLWIDVIKHYSLLWMR